MNFWNDANEIPTEDFDFREQRLVFDFLALHCALAKGNPDPTGTVYSKFFIEADNVYSRPVTSFRIRETPNDGHRLIMEISVPIDPLATIQANGLWNHVYEVAPSIQLPS